MPSARAGVMSFRGTLGAAGKTAIQMRLRREGDKLTLSYFYESVGKDLALRGTITAAGEHQVVVPYAALKDVIRPDSPLARFVK
jgi:hypothetical protein